MYSQQITRLLYISEESNNSKSLPLNALERKFPRLAQSPIQLSSFLYINSNAVTASKLGTYVACCNNNYAPNSRSTTIGHLPTFAAASIATVYTCNMQLLILCHRGFEWCRRQEIVSDKLGGRWATRPDLIAAFKLSYWAQCPACNAKQRLTVTAVGRLDGWTACWTFD